MAATGLRHRAGYIRRSQPICFFRASILHAPALYPAVPHHRTRAGIAPAHHIPPPSAAQLDRAGRADKSIAWPHPAAPP